MQCCWPLTKAAETPASRTYGNAVRSSAGPPSFGWLPPPLQEPLDRVCNAPYWVTPYIFSYPRGGRSLTRHQRQALPLTHPPAATYSTPTLAVTLPPSTSALRKHGRGSDANAETAETRDRGEIHNHASRLHMDIDVLKQVS